MLLTESEILRVFKEEHGRRFTALLEELDLYFKGDGAPENLLSKGLKVRHKESGILYTVHSVSPHDIVLKSPEGKLCKIEEEPFEEQFQLD
jgi:hypothetical protein